MTGTPASYRRFLQMLWFSAALHAIVIGLLNLSPQAPVSLPPELLVQITPPVAALPANMPEPEPEPAPQPPKPAPQPDLPKQLVQAIPQSAPVLPQPPVRPAVSIPAPPASAISQPAPVVQPFLAPSHEAPGPQVSAPLLVDTRYYPVKELDVLPVPLHKPEPAYPHQAEEQDISGKVLLRLHLESDGSISQADVVSVTPGGVFGELFKKSVLDAVRTLRFKPAKRNGLAVRALVEFWIVFDQGETN